MTKTKIIETTKYYDKDGKLYQEVIRKETSEDDSTTVISPYEWGGTTITTSGSAQINEAPSVTIN